MQITNTFDIKQGLSIISPCGMQKYTSKLDSYSSIMNQIYVSNFNDNNKFCIDSCWESENIYYVDYNSGLVKKIKFDGTVLATLQLVNPFAVSVIQNDSSMNTIVTYPPQDDRGCWIADKGTGKIIKTDKDLNIVATLNGVTTPVAVIADLDGGCYVIEEHTSGGTLIKVSSQGNVVCIKSYSAFSPAITSFIDIAIDSEGWVFVCANDILYCLQYDEGTLQQNYVAYPLSLISVGTEEKHIGAIDIDRNDIDRGVYVAGGNSQESFVVKYKAINSSVLAQNEYFDISFPYVLKVIQGSGSDSFYMLEDSVKWDNYAYGSSSSSSSSSFSSSSSSYILNWSSSSSSYVENWSSSSSSYDIPFGLGFTTYPNANGLWTLNGTQFGKPRFINATSDMYLAWQYYFGINEWVIKDVSSSTVLYIPSPEIPDYDNYNRTYSLVGGADEGTIS